MSIYAISDAAAKLAFSATDYSALEHGDVHLLTPADLQLAGKEFASDGEAVQYLAANGGGWSFDSEMCSYYTPSYSCRDVAKISAQQA